VLRVSAGAGATAVLGGCGGGADRQRRAPAASVGRDVAVLNRALGLERRAVAAYAAAIPLLSAGDKLIATVCLKQELLHAGRVIALITSLGGTPAPRADTYSLGRPRTTRQLLLLLHDVERVQIAGYLDAVRQLSDGHLRSAVASILADDAQHVTLIRGALGEAPVPSPFPSGKE
jgi:bacterioferritin (cytochrome b1)